MFGQQWCWGIAGGAGHVKAATGTNGPKLVNWCKTRSKAWDSYRSKCSGGDRSKFAEDDDRSNKSICPALIGC